MENVIGVCGLGCVGKTHYCNKLLDDYRREEKPRPVVLSLGAFFRTTLGPCFFMNLDNPGAPAATEHWVRNMVWFAIETARTNECDCILDGFPRTKLQLD